MRRVVRSIWLRVAVTLALLAIIGAQIDWTRIEKRLPGGHPLDFAIAVVLLGIGAWRWACCCVTPASSSRVARCCALSRVDVRRHVPADHGRRRRHPRAVVARRGPQLTRAAVTVLVDRAAGLGGLIALAWIALALDRAAVPDGSQTFLAWVTAVLVAGALAAAAVVLRGASGVRRLVPARMQATTRDTWVVLRRYLRAPRLVAALAVSSIVFQMLVALQLVVLARAIEVDLPFATSAVALALVTVVILVPVSIGGFGVREGSYVVLLGGASIAATDATLISVLSGAALFVASLPGAYLLARGGVAPALEAAPR